MAYWFALSHSSPYSGIGSYTAVQPRGFSDTSILRHRQSLTHKLIDLWFVVRVENSCCRLIKYSRRFNAKYWKTLSGRRVKFLKTCWSHGARPVQEDLHLAVINVSNGSGGGCFTLRGLPLPDTRAKMHIGFGPENKLHKFEAVVFQGPASRAAWRGLVGKKSSPTRAPALQHIGGAGWSSHDWLTSSARLCGQMESLFLQGCQFSTFHQFC